MINQELKNEISAIIKESPIHNDLDHANAALKWLLYLNPDADLALQISAFGHDIDRGVSKLTEKDRPKEVPYEKYKNDHARRSAEILTKILEERNYDQKFIEKVQNLVEKHEVGGDEDAEYLKDADSIAYFEFNIPMYLDRNGEEATRHKIHFMYDRASESAKNIIKEMKFTDPQIKKLIEEEIKGDVYERKRIYR